LLIYKTGLKAPVFFVQDRYNAAYQGFSNKHTIPMALLIELIPAIAFFITYQRAGLYAATISMMATSTMQLLISVIQRKQITMERWANVISLFLLGSMTLIFKNSDFIKFKATIGWVGLAIMFMVTAYRDNVTLLEKSFGSLWPVSKQPLSKQEWENLNTIWVAFFCLMGLLNLVVAYTMKTDTWVYFKLFGFIGFAFLVIGQVFYLLYSKQNQRDL
jgi:intracellular septation protein